MALSLIHYLSLSSGSSFSHSHSFSLLTTARCDLSLSLALVECLSRSLYVSIAHYLPLSQSCSLTHSLSPLSLTLLVSSSCNGGSDSLTRSHSLLDGAVCSLTLCLLSSLSALCPSLLTLPLCLSWNDAVCLTRCFSLSHTLGLPPCNHGCGTMSRYLSLTDSLTPETLTLIVSLSLVVSLAFAVRFSRLSRSLTIFL